MDSGKLMLTKDDILNADDLTEVTVSVPEWSGDVIVKSMSGVDRDEWERSIYHDGIKDFDNIRAKLCAMSIVDESSKKLFTMADIRTLGGKSGKALDRVFTVAKKLSGIGKQEILSLKKNLKPTR